MQPKQTKRKIDTDTAECLISDLLHNMATELNLLAASCAQVQWVISSLLERAQHPDMPAELHMLQDIDRIQQTLEDIAALLMTTSAQTVYPVLEKEKLSASLKLDSLRAKLFPRDHPDSGQQDSSAKSDVMWL